MNENFPRIITLLRKEQGISQKTASQDLEVSQALLSHYEKGIRECGLDFVVRCADYYNASCDYLLGRSPERTGLTLSVEEIPESDAIGKENIMRGSIKPVLNKKLITNSLNILFDLLQKSNNKLLIDEISAFIMISVYKMFRIMYSASQKNQSTMFTIPKSLSQSFATSNMQIAEALSQAVVSEENISGIEKITNPDALKMTTESLSATYPLFASSLLNLIQNVENRIEKQTSK